MDNQVLSNRLRSYGIQTCSEAQIWIYNFRSETLLRVMEQPLWTVRNPWHTRDWVYQHRVGQTVGYWQVRHLLRVEATWEDQLPWLCQNRCDLARVKRAVKDLNKTHNLAVFYLLLSKLRVPPSRPLTAREEEDISLHYEPSRARMNIWLMPLVLPLYRWLSLQLLWV